MDYEDIFRAAPDKDTFSRAKKQASARKWRNLQSNGKLTWGESKSSSAAYFKTIFDLSNPTQTLFQCNCPSRKRPCKHSLALAMLLHDQSGEFQITELVPEWVKELSAKKNKAALSPEAAEALEQKRAEERLKNREKRLQQMAVGLQELDLWIADILQQGLAKVEEQGEEFWQQLSARMTDAKLGGIGKRILNLQDLHKQPNRYLKMLTELGEIHLLSKGFQNLKQLPPALQEELLNVTGINYKREDLLDRETVLDTWLVVGQTEFTADDRLYERRTWLYGENLDRIGLFLDFAFQTEPYKEEWQVGQIFQAEMIFYPSAYPLRMFAKTAQRVDEPVHWVGYPDTDAFAHAYAHAIAQNPWLSRFPAFIAELTPVIEKGELLLIDQNKKCIKAEMAADFKWKLLAISGGRPLNVFGEWDGNKLKILSAIHRDGFVHFTLPPLERKQPVWKSFY